MDDASFMRRALELASAVEGSVSPRPPVGAVVVDARGEVVGEGATTSSPGPHAEVVALSRAGAAARGATVYVSLEPCSHTSVTPPCVRALLDAGVSRVVAGCLDPDPRVNGEGLRGLEAAGVDVEVGVEEDEALGLIEPFSTWVGTGRPFVTLKLAATLDGKVAAADGTSRWITGEVARAEVHELRRRVDGVLVGAGTVEIDDPALTSRPDPGRQPRRIVADSSGRTSPTAAIFDTSAEVVVVTTRDVDPSVWTEAGATVIAVDRSEAGVDLAAALAELGSLGLCHVLCEGGPTLAGSLVATGLVDRFVFYLAPKLIGGEGRSMLAACVKTLADAWALEVGDVSVVGDDIRLVARRAS